MKLTHVITTSLFLLSVCGCADDRYHAPDVRTSSSTVVNKNLSNWHTATEVTDVQTSVDDQSRMDLHPTASSPTSFTPGQVSNSPTTIQRSSNVMVQQRPVGEPIGPAAAMPASSVVKNTQSVQRTVAPTPPSESSFTPHRDTSNVSTTTTTTNGSSDW